MHPSREQLDRVFAALADPTRRAILAQLAEGEATVTDLVVPFGLRQPTISKHLKVLERAGLVSRGRTAQFRPVRLNAAPLESVARWIGGYRAFWEASFENLDAYVRRLHQPVGAPGTKEKHRHGEKDDPGVPRRRRR